LFFVFFCFFIFILEKPGSFVARGQERRRWLIRFYGVQLRIQSQPFSLFLKNTNRVKGDEKNINRVKGDEKRKVSQKRNRAPWNQIYDY